MNNNESDTTARKSDQAVTAAGLVKIYLDFWRRPKVRALDGIDLSVKRGEVFGLLGPNGSGKSTAIKLMLGLLRPSSGSISVLGRLPDDVAVKTNIGYMPEESYLYKYLSAGETLDFYGRLFGLGDTERRERVRQLLDMMELGRAGSRRVGEFSKGMARRVGLGQALINDPDLVILDEPTSGLDPVACRQVKDLILALAHRGKTVILASHLLADVEDICDRVAILYNGRIRAQGNMSELLARQDEVRITMKAIPPAKLERIIAAISGETGKAPSVDQPAQSLEEFFVELVARARREDAVTSYGGGIAPYLAGTAGNRVTGTHP